MGSFALSGNKSGNKIGSFALSGNSMSGFLRSAATSPLEHSNSNALMEAMTYLMLSPPALLMQRPYHVSLGSGSLG